MIALFDDFKDNRAFETSKGVWKITIRRRRLSKAKNFDEVTRVSKNLPQKRSFFRGGWWLATQPPKVSGGWVAGWPATSSRHLATSSRHQPPVIQPPGG